MTTRVKQASLQRAIERAVKRSQEISSKSPGVTEDFVQAQIDHVISRYQEFCVVQDQIEAVCGDGEIEGEYGNRAQAEDLYLVAVSNLKAVKRQIAIVENPLDKKDKPLPERLDSHLPRIKVPVFNGDYTNWTEFENLFADLIHNNKQLSNTQKLHYLKANLTGDAALLLKSVSVTNDNYEEAWRILRERYDHRRFIIDSHLRKFRAMPALQSESAVGLRSILDVSADTVRCLKVLGVPVTTWDVILINIVAEKLDPETHRQWELSLTRSQYPSYKELIDFLNTRWQSLEMTSLTRLKSNPSQPHQDATSSTYPSRTRLPRKHHTQSARSLVATSDSHISSCQVCAGDHPVFQCDQFKPLSFEERSDLIGKRRLCFNCLRPGHVSSACRSSLCRVCNKRHHTMLHNSAPRTELSSVESSSAAQVTVSHVASPITDVLLATAIAFVSHSSQQFCVRALLDSGSQISFISESTANRIGLSRKPAAVAISGICANEAPMSRSIVEFVLHSRIDSTFSISITALVVEKITGTLPSQPIDTQHWPHLKELDLADPQYYRPGRIDILLGADVIGMLHNGGSIIGVKGSPFAQNTKLGYVLFGKVDRETTNQLSSFMATIENYETIDSTLRSFWEIEDVSSFRELTHDELKCEQHYESTHYRNEDGRYSVFLPFNDNVSSLGKSRDGAIFRLHQIERRFSKNHQLRVEYNKFMQDYLESGHMEEVLNDDKIPPDRICYLPHHGVMQRKLRVVFDASHKTTNGVSLNQKLRIGPKLQNNIFEVLTRFRKHKFVFVADIKQMYRQILMAPEHRDYQRIVWRNSSDEPVRDYRLCTVTYGTTSAPYLAMRTINQLARDERTRFPIAAKVALSDFYVDDLITGADDIALLIETQRQIVALLRCGGFELRKWSSNSHQLLSEIPTEFREHQGQLELNWDECIKTLGIHWSPSADCFGFNISHTSDIRAPTKRIILSQSSKIFDPLGWVSPSTIIAKIILQELWVLGTSWDEAVPQSIAQRWLIYRGGLRSLESLKIKRWINHSESNGTIQIHGFSDASSKAYAAVLYARTISSDGSVNIHLLASKTKVAPLKTISLPRLELCASVLLARLIHTTVKSLNLPQAQMFAWTDSQVVLGWLRSPPNRWKTFVANRVSQILDYLQPTNWNYVDTKQNPADCASRGVDPSSLHSHPLWWTGPNWLREDTNQWPCQKTRETFTHIDARPIKSMLATNTEPMTCHNEIYSLLSRCSSLGKLLRVTAFCKRPIRCRRTAATTRLEYFITVPELNWSIEFWIKLVQATHFADEISRCQAGENLLNKSTIRSLNPFVDRNGILRVGGRLNQSILPYTRKHPIILPKENQLTTLIIAQAHLTTLHGGPQLMLAHLRKRYWILSVKTLVRSHVHKCVVCFRHRSIASQQIMAHLPSYRVTPSRPFQHSGVDYAGPIFIKLHKGRSRASTKGYICLFVCLSTKALHLELVSELTTEAFIASFRRFTARRGKIQSLYSDCGTNFVGSSRQLALLHMQSTGSVKPEIASLLAQDGTTWNFIPPASPHFGGLWEAGVKSVKHHLRRIMGETLLTFEELTTLLCQIEACLNSRPLCPMSEDPDDCTILTPGHFLIGEAPITLPEPTLLEVKLNRLNRYQLVQRMHQHFWKIWSTEYLSRLQQRPKWLKTNENLVTGQLVLIKEDNLPPSKWLLGRITNTHPGSDGRVRVATVKCQNSVYKRPVAKLCLLPIPDNDVSN